MNDKTIISAISKIHFILISTFSFILLTLFTIFILLQNGIYIDHISFPNLKAKKLYIKWNNKINIVVAELSITKNKKNDKYELDDKTITKALKNVVLFDSLFEKIIIENISYNDIKGSFTYIDGEDGFLKIHSPDFVFESSLFFESHHFNVQIDKLKDIKRDIHVTGNLILNTHGGVELTSSLSISINDDTQLNVYALSDTKKLLYKIESLQNIKNTRQIVDMFDIDPRIKYWIYDAIDMSSLSLSSASGSLEYGKMDEAYKNIHVKAVAYDLKYTYDEQLQSVDTSHTDLEFKEGVLYIRPQDAYSYDFFLDKSWLKIDFSKKEELLTLHLLFKGRVDEGLKSLLGRYKIELPFLQTKGNIDTNLKLAINLRTTDVEAVGDFYAKEAQINYLGLDLDIFDAHVFLNNSDVKVTNMFAKYKDIATSHVDLDFNAKKTEGTLNFRVNKVSLQDSNIELNSTLKPLHVTYTISPAQDLISIDKSTWKLKDNTIKIDAMKIPFDIDKLIAKIPVTSIELSDTASAFISGKILLETTKMDLNIDLLAFHYRDIKLNQSTAPLNLIYDKKFILSSLSPIRFDIANRDYSLDNIIVEIEPKTLIVKNMLLDIDNMLKSKISAEYSLQNSNGVVDIHNIEFTDSKIGEIFQNDTDIKLNFHTKNNTTFINSKKDDFELTSNESEWKLKVNSIEKIAKYSKILNKYGFINGDLTLYKKSDKENIKFSANTNYKYKVIATGNKLIDNYAITGEINTLSNDISLKINDSIDVKIKDDIVVKADNVGINIDEILNFFSDINSSKEGNSSINFTLDANDCYLYLSKNRHVISKKIKLQYFNKILTAQLTHKEGKAGFKLSDNKFHLYGEKFNDEFMDKLFALSKFKGGTLDFSINGTLKEYSGIMYVKNTTILDYKILNNILAFVNTVPSLVTFSLPGYNKRGLAVDDAYANFKFKDDVYKMSDISLESKEVNIVGVGEASIVKNSIDLDLNLKTDLGSSASKIPLLGYILLGEESISTSLKVTGALDNPDVNTRIAKDIIVAPINIIKRTLMLPFEIFKSKKDK